MKKILLLIMLFAPCMMMLGQSSKMKFPPSGKSSNDLIPKDCKFMRNVTGDLNADGVKDLVLVVKETNPLAVQFLEGSKDTLVDTNARWMAIYFVDSLGNFNLQFQDDTYIPHPYDEYDDEPFDILEITDKGVLRIGFKYWRSAGTWETSVERHLFKYNKDRNAFEMIGYYYNWFMRNSMEGEEVSVNFPAGKMSKKTNPMQDEKAKAVWTKFTLEKLKTLEEIAAPGTWQFMGLYI